MPMSIVAPCVGDGCLCVVGVSSCVVWLCACVLCVWGARMVCGPPTVVCCGGFLLSHTPWGAVPLARPGLASRFGMVLGVSPVL